MNLFSRLSEILNIDMAEPIEEWSDLEKLFAENERQMERDLTDVKRQAAAVVALERRLARELKRHRAIPCPSRSIPPIRTFLIARRDDGSEIEDFVAPVHSADCFEPMITKPMPASAIRMAMSCRG